MQDLANKLQAIAGQARNPDFDAARTELREATKAFAAYAIEDLADDPRYMALKVCDALAEFLNYWDRPKQADARCGHGDG